MKVSINGSLGFSLYASVTPEIINRSALSNHGGSTITNSTAWKKGTGSNAP
ncbi:TPA: hypothetical protein I9786_002459 [Serratia marcescens]|uniref:hypothetical protein n=1 Tax=Serratia marcescens TaxID=615 RepID=UPI000A4EBB64|nr:hypothetical protein [Serratia marcescens]HAT4984072.1 hypothetical protein [Serratia marcescens]HAT5031037.1 hypothetical protein [Serratia marcescens]